MVAMFGLLSLVRRPPAQEALLSSAGDCTTNPSRRAKRISAASAMASGLSGHECSIEELVGLLEDKEAVAVTD